MPQTTRIDPTEVPFWGLIDETIFDQQGNISSPKISKGFLHKKLNSQITFEW
jgi:hypothetical protein